MKIVKNHQDGFLLIEMVVYLFLFSLIVSGSLLIFYHLILNDQNISKEAVLFDEGRFVLGKISFILNNAEIYEPRFGRDSAILSVLNNGEKIILREEDGSVILEQEDSTNVLNNDLVKIENLKFENLDIFGPGQYIIKTSFTIGDNEFGLSRLIYE